MLDRYLGVDAWVSIININNGIKELICGYQTYNTNRFLVFDRYLKAYPSYYLGQYHSKLY